jgi:ligand-binding SRPBCC domain-containing protein
MNERTLARTTFVARPRAEVFAFFADPGNLETLTPPWLRFRLRTPRPIEMREGLRLDYRLRLRGLPIFWQSEITAWDPPYRFVDEQRRGPYRRWIHEHFFLERDGGTEIVDRVRYAVLGGRLVERLFVDRDLDRIFEFRRERIAELLAGRTPPPAAMRRPSSPAIARPAAGA